MSLFQNSMVLAEAGPYVINNSALFDSADNSYLSRTSTSSATWTFSCWVKRINLSAAMGILEGGLHFNSGNTITAEGLTTLEVFRDVSAFYHICVSNNGLEINGEVVGSVTTGVLTNPDIGREGTNYFNGLLANVHFIDGTSVAASNFGETDADGNWNPIAYSGSYGTEGYHLDFSDNTDLGKDVSGQGNHFTGTNINSQTPPHQIEDTPTNNYCVLDPLKPTYNGTLTDGNLEFTTSATPSEIIIGTFAIPSTGKWYWEVKKLESNSNWPAGISRIDDGDYVSQTHGIAYWASGSIYVDGVEEQTGLATMTTNDILGVAVDVGAGTVQFYKNNVALGTTESFNGEYFPSAGNYSSGLEYLFDFGQRGFTYTPPSGFVALNTNNLPEPAIADPGLHFNIVLYEGNATDAHDITGVGFQPDLVWIKDREESNHHGLFDTVRGVTNGLLSSATAAEAVYADSLVSFDADGFTLDEDTTNFVNGSITDHVAWCWKEGVTAGFDIVSETKVSTNETFNHSLGVIPDLMIVKDREAASSWQVYHKDMSASPHLGVIWLDLTNAYSAYNPSWNDTAPTSTQFTLGSHIGTNDFIAYLFTSIEGFSKFGIYEGNGNVNGPFVHLGFKPKYIMIKHIDSTSNWVIIDTTRNAYNVADSQLFPNSITTEAAIDTMDILSNGFKLVSTAFPNASGGDYIFMAFAEAPFKTARAR